MVGVVSVTSRVGGGSGGTVNGAASGPVVTSRAIVNSGVGLRAIGQGQTASALYTVLPPTVFTSVAKGSSSVGSLALQGSAGPPGPPGLASIYNEALAIKTQNVIPPLSLPFKAIPGAFANLIVGADTLVSGQGAVIFTDGSTAVSFFPAVAGFNVNPGDSVVAQYNVGD